MINEHSKLSKIYRIEDGIIYYNYYGKIYSREVCPEIVKLLTTRRKISIYGVNRMLVALYETEMRSINNYITGYDKEFTLIKPYPRNERKVRAVGAIDIVVNKKKLEL